MTDPTSTEIDRATVRRMWLLLEPVHALTYFSPEVTDAGRAVGLKGFWQTYFATRAAPMGPIGPEVCEATFFGFAPEPVRRALPSAWGAASPAEVLAAREAALRGVLTDVLGEGDARDLAVTADLATTAARGCGLAGRALFAGHATLPEPDPSEPALRLWWAATLLREHRGDGHVAALLAAGLDGLEANVVMAATGRVSRERFQGARGWSDERWEAAAGRLRGRGLLDGDDRLTEAGRAVRDEVEDRTDDLAAEPWHRLGPEPTARLDALLVPVQHAVVASGRIPDGNPIGLPVDPVA